MAIDRHGAGAEISGGAVGADLDRRAVGDEGGAGVGVVAGQDLGAGSASDKGDGVLDDPAEGVGISKEIREGGGTGGSGDGGVVGGTGDASHTWAVSIEIQNKGATAWSKDDGGAIRKCIRIPKHEILRATIGSIDGSPRSQHRGALVAIRTSKNHGSLLISYTGRSRARNRGVHGEHGVITESKIPSVRCDGDDAVRVQGVRVATRIKEHGII